MSYSGGDSTGAGHDEAAAAAAPYHNSAIARVVGKRITRRRLISRLNQHLFLTTPVKVIELNGGHFVLTFSDQDYLALKRLNQPWSIPFLCIHTIPFVPDFRPSQTPIHVVHAWIRLLELPIEKYDDLEEIAKRIGEDFVGIDPVTKSRLICKYARICVTLDLRKPLQSSVLIEGKLQEVEYEGFDSFSVCPTCKRVNGYCLCPASDSDSHRTRPFEKHPMIEKSGSSLRIDSPDVTVKIQGVPKQHGIECENGGSTLSVGIRSPDVPVKIEAVSKQKGKECVKAGIRINSPDAPVKIEAVATQKRKDCENAGSGIRIDSPHVPLGTEAVAKQIRKECEKAGSSVGIKSPEVHVKTEAGSKQQGKESVMAGSSVRISSPDAPMKIEAVATQKRKECENVASGIRIDSPHVPLDTEAVAKQIRKECEKAGSSVGIKSPDVHVKTEAGSKQQGKESVMGGSSVRISSPDAPVKIEAVGKQKRKGCENAGSGVRIESPHVSLNTEAVAKQIRTEYEKAKSPDVPMKTEADAKLKGKCGVSVSFPNFPKQSSAVTIKAPKSKHVASSVEDQFKSAKNSNPSTLIANHNNQLQSPAAESIPLLQTHSSLEKTLKFYLDMIRCSTRIKKITNTPFKETIVDGCPIVCTVESNFTSLGITLSEVHTRTTMASNQNQYDIGIVPISTGGAGSKVVSGSESCSKMLVWKFIGTEKAKLKQALKDLIQLHDPSIVLIIGTKISGADADQVVQELPYRCSYCRNPDDYNGGLWLLSRENVQVEVKPCSPQQVSASVYFCSETVPANSPLSVGTKTSVGPWGQPFFCTPTSWMSSETC